MEPFLFQIKQLIYQYPDGTAALQNLNLSIPQGKKIAIVGHNGAGKSTLFQHLNGLLKPHSGQILFNGEPIAYTSKALQVIRQQVGIVFQNSDAQLFSGTVKKDIAFGPLNLGIPKKEVEQLVQWAMTKTEVTELQDKPIHFLSIGQKKRVAIAGVLAMNPSVMILDEPTAGLDNYYANQLIQLLNELATENCTIILSTHDMQLAYEWADYIVVMHKGQIIYTGDPYQLFYNEHLLTFGNLERPWSFDIVNALKVKGILSANAEIPKTKQQILQVIDSINVKG